MSLFLRRLYSTIPKPPEVTSPTTARAVSSPLQVRRRRLRRQRSLALPPENSSSALSPSEQARYERLKRIGALVKEEKDGSVREPTEEEWLAELNEKRTRIRGVVRRTVKDPGTGEIATVEDVVGHRIYLPNIIFRMVRNYTPPGRAYNPWEATFHIPNSVTKLDVRSYLHAVYGVRCTYIRTDNYFAPIWRGKFRGIPQNLAARNRKSYKRAVVGLEEPFYYPEALEDMGLEERQKREQWSKENFRVDETREMLKNWRKETFLGRTWKSFNVSGNRGAILRSVIARRQEREREIDESAQKLLRPSQAQGGDP